MTLQRALGFASILWLLLALQSTRADTDGQQLAEAAGRPLIGRAAPRLILKTIDGQTIDLGRLYGKQAVYLKFWATWCVPCRQQMPHFEHVYETAGPDLAVIAINVGFNDSLEAVRAYRKQLGITMPIVLDDGRVAAAFNLRVTPQHIVIGRDGRIEYVGHLADARLDSALAAARLAPALNASAAGAPPTTASGIVHYKIGDRLPNRSLSTIDGRAFRFGIAGDSRLTVLVFLSPWCESYLATTRPEVSLNCRRMREQVAASADAGGVRWIGIASGLWATPKDLREYRAKYPVGIPLVLDESGALFRSFDVTEVPVAMIADASGRIVRRIEGIELSAPDAMRSAIRAP